MEKSFLKPFINIDDASLLSVQKEKLRELLNFYQDKTTGVCFLNGKAGSFKTDLFRHSLHFLKDDVLVFKFKCFEGTTLDDIFLAFFEDLKRYSQQKKITFTKIETNSLSQRINKYLNHISLPAVVLIDSLDNILNKNNQAEKEEIIAFIEHLNSMNKFKIIAILADFDELKPDITNTITIDMPPYTKEQIKEYFQNLNIENSNETLDKFYEIIRGRHNYLYISANIILTLKISLSSLINEYFTRKISFEDYILQKLITFVPDTVKKSLYILSALNEGISEKFLIDEKFFTKEQIAYMVEKGILSDEYGVIFLKNPIKKYLQNSVPHYEKIKIHTLWRDFYTSQLPVKPNERVILISRNTMRGQINYHSSFITENRIQEKTTHDMSLMSYLNSNLTAWNIKNTNSEQEITKETDVTQKQRPVPPESIKNRNFDKYELTKDELSLLNVPVDMQKKEEHAAKEKLYRTFEQKEEALKHEKEQKTISEVLELAQNFEDMHNFESAYSVYLESLNLKQDDNYHSSLPLILNKLAQCAKKLNRTADAVDCYNKLIELYSQRNEEEKINEARLEIAHIYKETYKINHARLIYENFIKKKTPASDSILFCAYIELAEIEEDLTNTDKAVEYYKKAFALNISNENTDPNYLAQAYFKYALILDDFNKTQAALDFYQKSIMTSTKPGVYLSAAYANVGEIMKESGNIHKAADYFKNALKTDYAQLNYEGVYYLCLKLSQVYEILNSDKVLDWLLKSLSAAKRTKDKLYIKNAYNKIGSYYKLNNEYEKAQKAYNMAQQIDNENGG